MFSAVPGAIARVEEEKRMLQRILSLTPEQQQVRMCLFLILFLVPDSRVFEDAHDFYFYFYLLSMITFKVTREGRVGMCVPVLSN